MWILINWFEYKYEVSIFINKVNWSDIKITHKCTWLMYNVQKYSCTVCHDLLIILMLTLIYELVNIYN